MHEQGRRPAVGKHKSILKEDFLMMDFEFYGTLISGRNQEIDIYRANGDFSDAAAAQSCVEIRVTLNAKNGAMDYSCISLSDERGAPILLVNQKSRTVNEEECELCLWEAIEHEERSLDYSYGRSPIGAGMKPGAMIISRDARQNFPEIS